MKSGQSWIISLLSIMAGVLSSCAAEPESDAWLALARTKAKDYFTDPLQLKLAQAIERGDTSATVELIKQGADVNAISRDDMRLLFWAMAKKRPKEFAILLQNGADPNISTEKLVNGQPLSIMESAATAENPEYLRAALKYKGNPDFPVDSGGRTIIFEAIMNERIQNVRLLMDHGADLSAQDTSGEAPVITAALVNSYDIVHFLLAKGADPSLKTKFGYDLARVMKEFGSRGIDPASEQYQWYLKVSAELKKRGLL